MHLQGPVCHDEKEEDGDDDDEHGGDADEDGGDADEDGGADFTFNNQFVFHQTQPILLVFVAVNQLLCFFSRKHA